MRKRILNPDEVPTKWHSYILFNQQTRVGHHTKIVCICSSCGNSREREIAALLNSINKRTFTGHCFSCQRKAAQGVKHPNWRGGHIFTKGYIRTHRPDHPFATKEGYVLEHRLVMEEKLGRLMIPTENVHHINGIKSDNRPENLELWTKPQPRGVRVGDPHCPTCKCHIYYPQPSTEPHQID